MSKLDPEVIVAAKAAQQETGVPACVALGQFILESGYGKELSASFNGLGMKWAPGCPYPFEEHWTQDAVDGKMQTIVARFISFPDFASAFLYYGHELTNPNGPYRKAKPFIRNWRGFLHVISAVYAPDNPHYEALVTEIISENHLESV